MIFFRASFYKLIIRNYESKWPWKVPDILQFPHTHNIRYKRTSPAYSFKNWEVATTIYLQRHLPSCVTLSRCRDRPIFREQKDNRKTKYSSTLIHDWVERLFQSLNLEPIPDSSNNSHHESSCIFCRRFEHPRIVKSSFWNGHIVSYQTADE